MHLIVLRNLLLDKAEQKYHDLSVENRSIICQSYRRDLLVNYHSITKFGFLLKSLSNSLGEQSSIVHQRSWLQ